MLEFYEFNVQNVLIIIVSTFIIYYFLKSIFSNNTKQKQSEKDSEKESEKYSDSLNIELLLLALLISILLSIVISYILSANDEKLLTDNFWENTELINN